jgi:hypothetical protein
MSAEQREAFAAAFEASYGSAFTHATSSSSISSTP